MAVNWEAVARAHLHPVALAVLEHVAQSDEPIGPRLVADATGADLAVVAHHFRKLRERGLIELVRQEQRRGAVANFYRLSARAKR